MQVLADIIPIAAALFMAFGFLWTGIQGLRGRSFWLPNRSGISGITVTGATARRVGFLFVVLGASLLILLMRVLFF